jgi:hypothetical protein
MSTDGASAGRTISFVLPVTLHETGLPGTRSRSWRRSADQGALQRTRTLLTSFLKQFRQTDLAGFLVVAPARDLQLLSATIRSLTSDPRYKLLDELDVCPEIGKFIQPDTGEISGWRAQQVVKLAASEYVSSQYYVTLDSDIICMHRFGYDQLVKDGLAMTNCEQPADYMRLYTGSFALAEMSTKILRYRKSGEILGCGPCTHAESGRFYGETPVVLRADMVSRLQAQMSERYSRHWVEVLAAKRGWTEYGLYYHFLEMTGQMDACCFYTGCNTVLDLERSVWHSSARYRHPRCYDLEHFAGKTVSGSAGLFVAIQSWLPLSSWLPSRCNSLNDFYLEIEQWIACNALG